MFQVLRKHFNPATVMAFAALVFAITGGAFAATGGRGGGGSGGGPSAKASASVGSRTVVAVAAKKKAAPKATRGPAGPKGATGPAGPAGPAGSAGAAGAKGENGAAGGQGPQGPQGEKGEKGESGSQGPSGTTGFTKTLPAKETETGEWGLSIPATGAYQHGLDVVSFVIPLAKAPAAHYLREDGKEPFFNETTKKEEQREQASCPGNVESPKALPGNLCIYASIEENSLTESEAIGEVYPTVCSEATGTAAGYGGTCLKSSGGDKYGFGVSALSVAEGSLLAVGTWAVTAAE
jgi:hypothetical protein